MPKFKKRIFVSDFSKLGLNDQILQSLDILGFVKMTNVQQIALVDALENQDLIVQAKTGSGKTAVFGLGVLNKIKPNQKNPQALILCPTRELASQVAINLRKFASMLPNVKILELCGGTPLRPQVASLERGADILVGTPGRILDHLGKQTLNLSQIKYFVLDEADKMLDLGFYEDIEKIGQYAKNRIQTMLFSATFSNNIEKLSGQILKNPKFLKSIDIPNEIKHEFFEIRDSETEKSLDLILKFYQPKSAIIFCETKILAKYFWDQIQRFGHSAIFLNGDLEQFERTEVLIRFSNKSVPILVCTDIASRGIDVKNVDLVININLPHLLENYIHRIGRTARGEDAQGLCVNLISKQTLVLNEIFEHFGLEENIKKVQDLIVQDNKCIKSEYFTVKIFAGKKQKIRNADIVGSLVKDCNVAFDNIAKIDILEFDTFVALKNCEANKLKKLMSKIKLKGKVFNFYFFDSRN